MTVTGSVMPASSFRVERKGESLAEIRFYSNIEEIAENDSTSWKYDEYIITRPYRDGLENDIENNYDAWLRQAKAEDEYRTPVDEYQLRADVDYLQITQSAMYGISLLDLSGTDPDVLEKARKYYPARWDEPRLRMLVTMQKLSETDFQAITGIPFNEGGNEPADASGESTEPTDTPESDPEGTENTETAGESSSEIVG